MRRARAHASLPWLLTIFRFSCRTCLPSSIVHDDAADVLPPKAFVSACILPGVLLLFRRHAWGQRKSGVSAARERGTH